ncbi:MAG: transcriptional regulator, TetR family [Candidatus Eremiobacteraeota bacterium]|nr:transcriptional regulator, TetR family [Candidatus Eremiobacteraeota bacterium]
MIVSSQRGHAGVEETRSRILTAARELFERKGTRGTTTREVAERAGVNEATLFRHFGSKSALLNAMREAACGFETFRSVVASLSGTDNAADLSRLARYVVDRMISKRAMMCVSLAEDATGTDDAPEFRGPAQLVSDLADYFTTKVAAGTMHGDPDLMARCFLGILFSSVVGRKLWGSDVPEQATLDGVVNIFLNGVR